MVERARSQFPRTPCDVEAIKANKKHSTMENVRCFARLISHPENTRVLEALAIVLECSADLPPGKQCMISTGPTTAPGSKARLIMGVSCSECNNKHNWSPTLARMLLIGTRVAHGKMIRRLISGHGVLTNLCGNPRCIRPSCIFWEDSDAHEERTVHQQGGDIIDCDHAEPCRPMDGVDIKRLNMQDAYWDPNADKKINWEVKVRGWLRHSTDTLEKKVNKKQLAQLERDKYFDDDELWE
ncbi:hypothetical protein N431DRAFT_78841 [Stipitochalara longipes BDJ]|nr:hypothetical protein N431DRAFT_78841 [Stipitochalara longipes BDJ]